MGTERAGGRKKVECRRKKQQPFSQVLYKQRLTQTWGHYLSKTVAVTPLLGRLTSRCTAGLRVVHAMCDIEHHHHAFEASSLKPHLFGLQRNAEWRAANDAGRDTDRPWARRLGRKSGPSYSSLSAPTAIERPKRDQPQRQDNRRMMEDMAHGISWHKPMETHNATNDKQDDNQTEANPTKPSSHRRIGQVRQVIWNQENS